LVITWSIAVILAVMATFAVVVMILVIHDLTTIPVPVPIPTSVPAR
jgi:hypothetical protein